ncbi:hypothetical protein [Algoriphagus alkaliphilus]|uniref:hypothetical protein n=1 Tax=Algoriphagus alkaliphilus TaxID=279824 RepID=UPI0011144672|nr:hypothetical protein [Algoriphagus alkaliphilus]
MVFNSWIKNEGIIRSCGRIIVWNRRSIPMRNGNEFWVIEWSLGTQTTVGDHYAVTSVRTRLKISDPG